MKYLMIIPAIAFTINIYSQNPLESGIHSAGRIVYDDPEFKSVVYNSTISFPDDCSATYKFTQDWNDGFVEKVSNYEVKWYWKDITMIKVDKILNVLELDTDAKAVETSTDLGTNTTVKDNKQSDIGIYFKNIDDLLKAADWAELKIKNCGGKVTVYK
jgi:hypothetical protein